MQTGAENLRIVASSNLDSCDEDFRLGVIIAHEKFLFTKCFSAFKFLLSLDLTL